MNNKEYCINNYLNQLTIPKEKESKGNEVNFIHLFEDANKNEKISIIGEYVDVNANLNDTKSVNNFSKSSYYGLSPLVSGDVVFKALQNNLFHSASQLKVFVKSLKEIDSKTSVFKLRKNDVFENYVSSFCLKKEDKVDTCSTTEAILATFEEALLFKTLVKMATNFGVKFEVNDCLDELCEFLSKNNDCFVNNVNYKLPLSTNQLKNSVGNKKSNIEKAQVFFTLLGNPSEEIANRLSKKFVVLKDNETLKISLINRKTSNQQEQNLVNININIIQFNHFITNDYSQYLAILGSVYYSGVMPKLLKVESYYDALSNKKIKIIKLTFCKTTFATLDAFDNSIIKMHPLLADYKDAIDIVDSFEDTQLKIIFDDIDKGLSTNGNYKLPNTLLNNYLSCSLNSNTIAVSADITTSDKFHIYVERNAKSIDYNTIYCSANGQSEIYDKSVSFYNNSVYEDCPTINIEKVGRIDFTKELERESFAELGVETMEGLWEYYGISMLGIKNFDDNGKALDTINYRRLHFNILAKNKTTKTLLEVEKQMKTATESFENKAIYGMKLTLVNSSYGMFKEFLSSFSKVFLKMKDWILPVFAIIVFIFSFSNNNANFYSLAKIESLIKQVFSVLLFLITIKDSLISLKNVIEKHRKSFYIHKKILSINNVTQIKQCFKKADKFYYNHKTKMHPIAKLMMLLSINDKCGIDK